jgi:hypothetical protein
MIDVQQSCTLAEGGRVVPRERTPVLPQGLRDLLRGFLLALHESRRRRAAQELRRHSHLVEPDGVHRLDGAGR